MLIIIMWNDAVALTYYLLFM